MPGFSPSQENKGFLCSPRSSGLGAVCVSGPSLSLLVGVGFSPAIYEVVLFSWYSRRAQVIWLHGCRSIA